MPPHQEPTLFLWSLSPWASKITAYLALRRIPHTRCEQPITQPRPDLAALGLNYRRIPVLALGRDIYCDTLLILSKFDELYAPSERHPEISARSKGGTDYALEKLLEKWTDTVVFKPAAAVIPTELDLMKDPGFQRDREELWGRPWSKEEQEALRPKGLADLRANFELLEATLQDGREWIAGGREEPGMADVHSAWIFDWLLLINALDTTFFNSTIYPQTYAWLARYRAALDSAKASAPQPTELSGPDAVSKILGSEFLEPDAELKVEDDPEGFKEGEEVEMWPVDTGFNRRDRGRLVKLGVHEAVVQRGSGRDGAREVRIHYPRWNFCIQRVGEGDGGQNGMGGENGEFVSLN